MKSAGVIGRLQSNAGHFSRRHRGTSATSVLAAGLAATSCGLRLRGSAGAHSAAQGDRRRLGAADVQLRETGEGDGVLDTRRRAAGQLECRQHGVDCVQRRSHLLLMQQMSLGSVAGMLGDVISDILVNLLVVGSCRCGAEIAASLKQVGRLRQQSGGLGAQRIDDQDGALVDRALGGVAAESAGRRHPAVDHADHLAGSERRSGLAVLRPPEGAHLAKRHVLGCRSQQLAAQPFKRSHLAGVDEAAADNAAAVLADAEAEGQAAADPISWVLRRPDRGVDNVHHRAQARVVAAHGSHVTVVAPDRHLAVGGGAVAQRDRQDAGLPALAGVDKAGRVLGDDQAADCEMGGVGGQRVQGPMRTVHGQAQEVGHGWNAEQLLDDEKASTLDFANYLRRNTVPKASDMNGLVPFEHNYSGPYASLGEILYRGGSRNFQHILAFMFLERENYNYSTGQCSGAKYPFFTTCGHYLQLVHAATSRIGCAVQLCNGVYLAACEFSRQYASPPYLSGEPGTKCGNGYATYSQQGLCYAIMYGEPAPIPGPFDCKLTCMNYGNLTTMPFCSCTCPPGFYGVRCEKKNIYYASSIPNDCTAQAVSCKNGGSPTMLGSACKCVCPTNFGGESCEVNLQQMKSSLFVYLGGKTIYQSYHPVNLTLWNATGMRGSFKQALTSGINNYCLSNSPLCCSNASQPVGGAFVQAENFHDTDNYPSQEIDGTMVAAVHYTLSTTVAMQCNSGLPLLNKSILLEAWKTIETELKQAVLQESGLNVVRIENRTPKTNSHRPTGSSKQLPRYNMDTTKSLCLCAFLAFALAIQIGRCKLTEQERNDTLNFINHLRRNAVPPAADMNGLIWDTRLENLAQRAANSCVFEHNYGGDYSSLGEILYLGSRQNFSEILVFMFLEREQYNYTNGACVTGSGKYPFFSTCGHYLQIVTAGVNKVGCGIQYCSGNYLGVCEFDRVQAELSKLWHADDFAILLVFMPSWLLRSQMRNSTASSLPATIQHFATCEDFHVADSYPIQAIDGSMRVDVYYTMQPSVDNVCNGKTNSYVSKAIIKSAWTTAMKNINAAISAIGLKAIKAD
uniref:SCP domain-containing protein n=1 Tax=Macrostomum lignano TaxID=282301 RepID=A0A1I8HJ92_9PLAT